MKGKCIKKIFRIFSHDEIEFKLAISAILLNFQGIEDSMSNFLDNKESNNKNSNYNTNYILKIVMTSFNPIELTTKLGGPWEGYFVWDIIRGKILNDFDQVDQKNSLLNFLEMIDEDSPSENLLTMNLMKYCEYMDKIPKLRPSGSTFEENTKEKDYILIIKFQELESEIILHLRSTFYNNTKETPTMENINIITCLKEMVELIKLENFNLHENLRNLTELSNNKQVITNKENEESQKIIENDNNVINQFNSPNTRGTLELSELRIPSYLYNSQENNNSKLQDFDNLSLIDKYNNNNNDNVNINVNADSKLSGSDLLQSQIKTYRFIKNSSKMGNDYYDSYSTSSLPVFNTSSYSRTNGKNSALRYAIDSVRKSQNSALSNRFNFNSDFDDFSNYQDFTSKYNNSTISSEYESDKYFFSKYIQKFNKNRQRKHNDEEFNTKNYIINEWNKDQDELKTPINIKKKNPLYTREQLMSKLSNTKDISERINILKSMIKSTKKESYLIDEFD